MPKRRDCIASRRRIGDVTLQKAPIQLRRYWRNFEMGIKVTRIVIVARIVHRAALAKQTRGTDLSNPQLAHFVVVVFAVQNVPLL